MKRLDFGVIGLLFYGRWLQWFLFAMAALAWFATPALLLREAIGETKASILGAISLLVFLLAVYTIKWRSLAAKFTAVLVNKPPPLWMGLLLGLVIRIVWITVFPAEPSSDGAVYVQLAQKLVSGLNYEVDGTRAYWPPGYPFFLCPWLYLFPVNFAIIFSQLSLFLIGGLGCYRLTASLSGEPAARLALILFASWPNLVTQSGIPAKEYLVIALLPWVIRLILSGQKKPNLFAGLLMGFITLTQPSFQLLIIALAVFQLLRGGTKVWRQALLFVLGTVMVIGPWTYRNYQVFDRYLMITSNGGSVFYRANNPLATGGFTPRGEVELTEFSELDKDKEAKQLAVRWIKEHPADFLSLVAEKQLRFMGDDAVGVYETLKRGNASDNKTLYTVFKLASNAWWLLIWLLIAGLTRNESPAYAEYRFLVFGWLYLFGIHSVFESAGKYHVPMLWVLCVGLPCMLFRLQFMENGKSRSKT